MPEIDTQQASKLASAVASLAAIVAEIQGEFAEPPPHIKQRVADYLNRGICLRCGLKTEGRVTRGMDANCYNLTLKEFERGEKTEAEQIQLGRITAKPLPGGRKPKRPASGIGELPPLDTGDIPEIGEAQARTDRDHGLAPGEIPQPGSKPAKPKKPAKK